MSDDKRTRQELVFLSAHGFDLDRYIQLLDEPAMSDAQKREFVGALWGLLQNFVDAAFDEKVAEAGQGGAAA